MIELRTEAPALTITPGDSTEFSTRPSMVQPGDMTDRCMWARAGD